MNIKKAAKIADTYKEIKKLDDQIINLEKYAGTVLADELAVKIRLECDKPRSKQDVLDDDGSLISPEKPGYYKGFYESIFADFSAKKTKQTNDLDLMLHDFEALAVIGTVLAIKKKQREELLKKLEQ